LRAVLYFRLLYTRPCESH